MKSLVLDLQSDALDDGISVNQLLRKARVLSTKLNATELGSWLDHEARGYPMDVELPKYRKVIGQPKIRNPYYGLQPLIMADSYSAHFISSSDIRQSIVELESLKLENGGVLHVDYPNKIKIELMKAMTVALEPMLIINPASIVAIIDSVRNTILEWTLELEKSGVLGEGLQFSTKDVEKAVPATYQITNNIGAMHGSQLQQLSNGSSQKLSNETDLEALRVIVEGITQSIGKMELEVAVEEQLSTKVAEALEEIDAPKKDYSGIEECINSIRSILEAAAGNVMAAGYLHQLGGILS